jgi:coiled-coil-helix-coiled-coil-helix domain-containing protein 2
MVPQQQGPGIMGQIAANAASVAIGSVVAHTVMGAMRGNSDAPAAAAPQAAQAAPAQAAPAYAPAPPQQGQNPCAYEIEQFLNCANRYGIHRDFGKLV